MPAPHRLEIAVANQWPSNQWQDVTVLLAVSGGPDSVAMLRAMTALTPSGEGRLVAAHLNHGIREIESQADELFVVELCRRLDICCEVDRLPIGGLVADSRDGLEAVARKARYEFLQKTAARLGARYVVTGHTADDQAETILHRILRGTGITGLAGMPRARPLGPATTLIRPLLGFRRSELLTYLGDLNQPYRHDSSNDQVDFTRNRIRHHLLPQLAGNFNPAVVEALLRLGSLAGEVQTVIDRLVAELIEKCVTEGPSDEVRIKADPLADLPDYVSRELLIAVWKNRNWPLQSMGFAEWDLLAQMLLEGQSDTASAPRKRAFPGSLMAEINGRELRLTRR